MSRRKAMNTAPQDEEALHTSISEPSSEDCTPLLLHGGDELGHRRIRRRSSHSLHGRRVKKSCRTLSKFATLCVLTIGIVIGHLLNHVEWWRWIRASIPSTYHGGVYRNACLEFEDDCDIIAPYIFASVFSLLKQWPNSYAPNGHSIVTGTLQPNISIFHARQVLGALPKPTFFALDADMSIGMYGGSGTTRLHTCTLTRKLSVLYLDGTSASLTTSGSLDSQFALLNSSVPLDPTYDQVYDEHARAKQWCQYLSGLNIGGLVRMNAGFEIMLCNYEESGVLCPYSTDVTIPGNEAIEADPNLPKDPNRIPPDGYGNVFAPQYGWEWVRSATWHYGTRASSGAALRERRVNLDYCSIITFYDPSLRSLSGAHHAGIQDGGSYQNGWGLRRGHRLLNLSSDDSNTVAEHVVQAIEDLDSPSATCSDTDWQLITELITDQHKSRMLEVDFTLRQAIQGVIRPEEAFTTVRALTHQAVVTYWEHGNFANMRKRDRDRGHQLCTSAYTGHLSDEKIGVREILIKHAVEKVLGSVCSWEFDTFITAQAWIDTSAVSSRKDAMASTLTKLHKASSKLIKHLGWDDWVECPEKCGEMELCYIPMWPVIYAPNMVQGAIYGGENLTEEETEHFWMPKCLSQADWDCGGTRGREPEFQIPNVPPRQCRHNFKSRKLF